MEKATTVDKLAAEYGYPEAFIRGACNRSAEHHPLPHVRSGSSKRCIRVRPSVFERWVIEEELVTVGANQ